jgi:hypothetical protein
MHCQQGGEVWACFGLLNTYRRFPSGFELFLSSSNFQMVINLTGALHRSDCCSSQVLGDLAHRSDRCGWPVWPFQSKAEAATLFCKVVCIHWFRGSCIGSGGVALVQGELACVQGELFVVFELWIIGLCYLLEHGFVSDVSSRCPCLRGSRLVFFKWSCFLPFFGFRSLVGVSFSRFFSFLFLLITKTCVLSMHSSRGRLRAMCGSRTGGWSLPSVMNDWQHGVD